MNPSWLAASFPYCLGARHLFDSGLRALKLDLARIGFDTGISVLPAAAFADYDTSGAGIALNRQNVGVSSHQVHLFRAS